RLLSRLDRAQHRRQTRRRGWSRLRTLSNRPSDKNKDDCPDEAGNEITDPTGTEPHTNEAEQPTRNSGSYDAQNDVHENSHLALHELLGEPASDSANDDSCDPADLLILHGVLLKGVKQSPDDLWFRWKICSVCPSVANLVVSASQSPARPVGRRHPFGYAGQ